MRAVASLGDTWHFGIVTVTADEHTAVREVLGLRGHIGKLAAPGGIAYLVVPAPGEPRAVLAKLRERYDPAVTVVVDTANGHSNDVVIAAAGSHRAVTSAVDAFFAGGDPATLPGFAGRPAFRISRQRGRDTTVVVRGLSAAAAVNAAQTLRYLIAYLRPRL